MKPRGWEFKSGLLLGKTLSKVILNKLQSEQWSILNPFLYHLYQNWKLISTNTVIKKRILIFSSILCNFNPLITATDKEWLANKCLFLTDIYLHTICTAFPRHGHIETLSLLGFGTNMLHGIKEITSLLTAYSLSLPMFFLNFLISL